jgi:hypothetical protein
VVNVAGMAKYSTVSLAIKVELLELAYLFSKMHIKLVIKSLEPLYKHSLKEKKYVLK